MPGMFRYFVLRIHKVNFLVRIINEHIFRAAFHALDRAFTRAIVCAFRPAVTVGYIACPGSVRGHGQCCCEECCCRDCCKSYLHRFLPSKNPLHLLPGWVASRLSQQACPVHPHRSRPAAAKHFLVSRAKKRGKVLWNPPPALLSHDRKLGLCYEALIDPSLSCWLPSC